jgi:PAS domain S-box-containing protein
MCLLLSKKNFTKHYFIAASMTYNELLAAYKQLQEEHQELKLQITHLVALEKEASAILPEAERRIRVETAQKNAILKAIPDLIFVMNDKGIYIASKGNEMNSYREGDDIVGTSIYDSTLPKEVIELIMLTNKKALETGEIQHIEYQLPSANHVLSYYYESRAIKYADNLIIRLVRDISEKKKSEERIRTAEMHKKAILRAIPDMLFVLNERGECIDFRGGIATKSFIDPDHVIGYNIDTFQMPAHIIAWWQEDNQKALETGEIQVSDYKMELPDGVYYYETRTVRYMRKQVLKIVRDITERKVAEEKIQAEENRKNAILRAIPDMIFVMNEKGDYLDFRGGHGKVFIDSAIIIGSNITDAKMPKEIMDMLLAENKKALESGEIHFSEYFLRFDNGLRFYESRTVRYARNQVLRIVRDITPQKVVEAENKQLLEELQVANEELSSSSEEIRQTLEHTLLLKNEVEQKEGFLRRVNEDLVNQNRQLSHYSYVVSHNLRAPVATILGLISLFEMQPFDNPETVELLQMLKNSSIKLDEVVRDLNYILSETRIVQQQQQIVYFEEEMYNILSNLSIQIQNCQAEVNYTFEKSPRIWASKTFIHNVLLNLFTNCLKFREPARKLVIDIKTQIIDEKYICLSIKDNGMGIDVETQEENLFKLYKRFHPQIEGKGIGLYLIKTQVEIQGGRVELKSALQQGTTVEVYFAI